MREIYQINKESEPRDFEAVEELPPGKQLQVDWGQTVQKTKGEKEVRLYFIAFVLAHSRQKFMIWQDRPFTTQDTIRCHEQAFQFYTGIPEEIVFDQDNLIAVSENHGDIILTAAFQRYVKEKKFRVYLCRKADPESKGKVENVVKYIKQNFAKHRVYDTLEDWNERAWQWLERTGNYKVHNTTKKRPFEVFLLEKQHLRKVSTSLSLSESPSSEIITRNVTKDNTIRFESNRYSVPIGTYNKIKTVQIHMKGQQLLVIDSSSGEILAEHTICTEKGKLVKNRNHSRDRSTSLEQLKQKVINLFAHDEAASYIGTICDTYGRYRRDQLTLLQKVATEDPDWVHTAIEKCVHEKLYSANDFRDVVAFLKREQKETVIEPTATQAKSVSIPVQTRDLKEYVHRMGGQVHE